MSQHDDHDPSRAPSPDPADVSPPQPPPAGPPPGPRWRDRVFRLRAMVAVGLAGLVLGAGAGAGIALVAGHEDRPDLDRQRMVGPGEDGFPGWGGRDGQGGPPPGMEQLPPGMQQQEGGAPQDGSSSGTTDGPSGT